MFFDPDKVWEDLLDSLSDAQEAALIRLLISGNELDLDTFLKLLDSDDDFHYVSQRDRSLFDKFNGVSRYELTQPQSSVLLRRQSLVKAFSDTEVGIATREHVRNELVKGGVFDLNPSATNREFEDEIWPTIVQGRINMPWCSKHFKTGGAVLSDEWGKAFYNTGDFEKLVLQELDGNQGHDIVRRVCKDIVSQGVRSHFYGNDGYVAEQLFKLLSSEQDLSRYYLERVKKASGRDITGAFCDMS